MQKHLFSYSLCVLKVKPVPKDKFHYLCSRITAKKFTGFECVEEAIHKTNFMNAVCKKYRYNNSLGCGSSGDQWFNNGKEQCVEIGRVPFKFFN